MKYARQVEFVAVDDKLALETLGFCQSIPALQSACVYVHFTDLVPLLPKGSVVVVNL